MSVYPLLELSSRLQAALPPCGLLQGATPVQPLPESVGVFVKRDDLSAADYGGNKIRKLDFLLGAARRRGARELLTFGYAGSNFVAATAWHGRKFGLRTTACLLPQVSADYVEGNLAVGLHAGAQLQLHADEPRIALAALKHSAHVLLRSGRLPLWIPPGGSSPLGVAGFVNAALELQRQVVGGELPEPEVIYVAFSSMGTVAGLALGLELAGLRTRIVAVQVVGERHATFAKLQALIRRSSSWLGRLHAPFASLHQAALRRVRIRREYLGEDYALPTVQTQAAISRFSAATGARADSAYSGKALACLYDDLDAGALAGQTVLYWHTFNAHDLPPGVSLPSLQAVPPGLRPYFSPPAVPG